MKRVLIANRSEVALRIQATCHAQGLETVAIFSSEDRFASFVYLATHAYQLSFSGSAAYFAQDQIINLALSSGADALHPGYGFLSENAEFAQKVIDAGILWIGPNPAAMALMADKVRARETMLEAGVPVVPGFIVPELTEQAQAQAKARATAFGYPVIIKDPKSGGGKAMRRVDHEDEFDRAWDGVIAESKKLTGSTFLLIEKYLTHGRHIEVQVAGDGNQFIHLFERECSIQRRHQKIIEETPCNFVDKQTLEKMYAAAVGAAQAVNYNSIGTVEFMVTPDQNFYFLEMNTRLQVEHAVTEMTTGIDLVALQLHIAQHKQLPVQQQDIVQRGHALECRIYAEDPSQRFTPSTGVIRHLALPSGPFVRVDADLAQDREVTPFFDPMIAKFVTFGITREQSTARMLEALAQFKLDGIKTNRDFLRNILACPEFIEGNFHTQTLSGQDFMQRMLQSSQPTHDEQIIAGIAALLLEHEQKQGPSDSTQVVQQRLWRQQQWK